MRSLSEALRSRGAFLFSVGLSFAALGLVEVARHQLALAARLGYDAPLSARCSHFGTLLLYMSWVLAIGAAESLAASRRNLEPYSPWPIIALLGAFLYLGLVR